MRTPNIKGCFAGQQNNSPRRRKGREVKYAILCVLGACAVLAKTALPTGLAF
jgi:hypothetical protein